MKYRKDFVTNSSSSSFTCDICGAEESGWDYGLSDVCMVRCENGHEFCEHHLRELPAKEIIAAILRVDKAEADWHKKLGYEHEPLDRSLLETSSTDDLWDTYIGMDDVRYSVDPKFCPICSLESVDDQDIIAYFLKKNNLKREEMPYVWQREFGTYAKLKEYIRR